MIYVVTKAHKGSIIEQAENSQKLQGKVPSDFLAVGGKAVDADKLDGLDSSQFVRNDQSGTINGTLKVAGDIVAKDHLTIAYNNISQERWRFWYNGTSGRLELQSFNDTEWIAQLQLPHRNANGDMVLNGYIVLNTGNLSSHLATASKDGFMAKGDKSKLDGIQSGAMNQSTSDGRYVQLTGSNLTGSLAWNGDQDYKGIYWGAKHEGANAGYAQLAFIRQGTAEGQLQIGSDDLIDFMESDNMVSKIRMLMNAGNLEVDGSIREGGTYLIDKYAPKSHVGTGGTAHALVTASAHGFMSAGDKGKLDGIQTGAINQTTADGRYLNLTGGSLTGQISSNVDGYSSGALKVNGHTVFGTISNKAVVYNTSAGWVFRNHNASINDGNIFEVDQNGVGRLIGNVIFHNGNKSSYKASPTSDGFMSKEDKARFDQMETGGEVNQNAFSHIAVAGNSTINANSKTSTLTFNAGAGIQITTDASGMTVGFTSTLTSDYLALDGSNSMRGDLVFSSGQKRIVFPSSQIRDNGTGALIISNTSSGKTIYLRPNGDSSTTNELVIGTSSLTIGGNSIYHAGNFNPSSKLDVTTYNSHANNSSIHKNWGSWDTSGDREFRAYTKRAFVAYDTTAGNRLVINYGGDFVNGVDVQSKMSVSGTLTTGGVLSVNTSTGTLQMGSKNTSHLHVETDRNNFYFNKELQVVGGRFIAYGTSDLTLVAGGDRVTVKNSSGNVGIGIASPAEKLDVAGNVKATSFNGSLNGKVTSTTESRFSLGTFSDPHVGTNYAIKVSGGIATNKVNIGGKVEVVYNSIENSLDFVFI